MKCPATAWRRVYAGQIPIRPESCLGFDLGVKIEKVRAPVAASLP